MLVVHTQHIPQHLRVGAEKVQSSTHTGDEIKTAIINFTFFLSPTQNTRESVIELWISVAMVNFGFSVLIWSCESIRVGWWWSMPSISVAVCSVSWQPRFSCQMKQICLSVGGGSFRCLSLVCTHTTSDSYHSEAWFNHHTALSLVQLTLFHPLILLYYASYVSHSKKVAFASCLFTQWLHSTPCTDERNNHHK